MTADLAAIDRAIAEAHLPTLVMSIVHLTGDTSLLRGERPVYAMLDERQRTLSDETKALIRARARSAIADLRDGKPVPPPPDQAVVREMMNYIAGTDIAEAYVPFLMDELSLDGLDPNQPRWSEPVLQAASATMFVVVIGAGLSGILAGLRLQQAGIAFVMIERNADVGGTWFDNTYPGCRVDSTNHMYSYSFDTAGHAWPNWYSPQATLLDYFRGVTDRHGLRAHIRFGNEVTEAVYDAARPGWNVRVRSSDGREEVLAATAVISAVGQLNDPKLPDIPGMDRFAGVAFHSARWRHDVDLRGKRVAVIGTGASAFQFVPEIAPEVENLVIFQRSPPWIMPTRNYHDRVGPGFQWLLDHVPFYEKWWRFFLFWSFTESVYESVKADPDWTGGPSAVSAANARIADYLARQMTGQLVGAEHLAPAIIPTTPFGSKRALRDNGAWIKTLRRDNVQLVTEAIREVTPSGVVMADGVEHKVDVLIYGTGFRASEFLRTIRVAGRDGIELSKVWAGDARAHLGVDMPGFPNFFMLFGPNTNIVVNGSIIFFSECAVHYVISCLEMLARQRAGALEIRPDLFETFNAAVDAGNAAMAWGVPHVSNWYKNSTGRVSQNWPFPILDYWYATREPNPADFILHRTDAPFASAG